MSERNGDKSRFGQERQRKILRRKRVRELRKALELEGKATDPQTVPRTGQEKASHAHGSLSS